jgi:prepilin-type N-terminal cleavage/methylation domain-containing protein
MKTEFSRRKAHRGVSLIELLVVVFVTLILAAMASPNIMRAVYNTRLRSTGGDLSGLIQQARIMAAKDNTPYDIQYTTLNG